jgi:FeS assembly SUF system protein
MSDETATAPTEAPSATSASAPSATSASAPSATAPDLLSATEHGDGTSLQDKVVEALSSVFDPEIPVNIYELGLIYDIDVAGDREVTVTMTLTAPNCPVAGSLPGEVQDKIAAIDGVKKAHVNLVWEPAWTPERMSEAAKLELGWL